MTGTWERDHDGRARSRGALDVAAGVPPHRSPAPLAVPDAVLFDFGGTLDADGLPWSARFLRAYRARGGTAADETFDSIFRASDQRLLQLPEIRQLGFRDTIDAQGRLLAALLPDGKSVDMQRVARDVHADAVAVLARNRELLRALHARARLGIISNFTGNLERCLSELELSSFFDVVIDSAIVGITKPDPEIFALALSRLGVAPERALMVGDNPFADVRAAAACGLSTCWLSPASREIPDGCAPTTRIANLGDLLNVLGLRDSPGDSDSASRSPAAE